MDVLLGGGTDDSHWADGGRWYQISPCYSEWMAIQNKCIVRLRNFPFRPLLAMSN